MSKGDIILWVCLFIAVGLMAWGFLMPPPGEIHATALIGAGEVLLFGVAAAAEYRADRKRGDDND